MSEEPENLTLVYLRRIDEKIDRLADDVRELKTRMGLVEAQYASLSSRIDRMDDRVQRIERRLDISLPH